ncbi:ABC transporter ATP-binding protein/permease [Acholeplasma sp. OttesenSCG-928-E16]|nr:ABC transporter ATP-binding protein/permease [Acholeplasma sp. OttesenSCG-928-E16]
MLRLKKVVKNYYVGDNVIEALKGVDLSFRKSEFVSILGPSGCGKTTMLNIIGGLDQYTSGDLIINGISTKKFKDHDWDVYRNHRIGFVFQSYNLIPHQTVLGNVELALTIAGLSKVERQEKAKKALDRVGLSDQYYKRPNQLSGGQSQRVAIARALVNDPEILLADEPTGALDSVTSVQIMDLIKEIANERLVIMVTHNADIADKYSTRIVKLLDGKVIDDSNPFSEEEEKKEVEEIIASIKKIEENETKKEKKKGERAKMSFFTAFIFSMKNLLTKKGRTIMTGFAGSIGIIGISLVLAISSGVSNFIVDMQDDLLSGNPIEITETTYDLNALMGNLGPVDVIEGYKKDGYISVDSLVETLIKRVDDISAIAVKNDIDEAYVNYVKLMPEEYYSAIDLGYGIDVTNNIFTDFHISTGDTPQNISLSSLTKIYTSLLNETEFKEYSSYITSLTTIMQQAPADADYISTQYDLIAGTNVANAYNEVMLVVNKETEATDLLLAQLGYYTQEEFLNIAYRATNTTETSGGSGYDPDLDKMNFSYEEILGKEFYYYPNDQLYNENYMIDPFTPFTYNYKNDGSFTDGVPLKVVGILKPKKEVSYGILTRGFYYTKALTDHILESNKDSKIVKYMETADIDGFTYVASQGQKVTYTYEYVFDGTLMTATGIVGADSSMALLDLFPGMGGGSGTPSIVSLSKRHLGGNDLANRLSIYPKNFDLKNEVTKYLDAWNDDGIINMEGFPPLSKDDRSKITYTDSVTLIVSLINNMINIVTYALVSFTALSLLVSTVMIGIITYVSVVERVKEIGVIRSLGGRKKDVSNLFIAETGIIGFVAGVIGILVTYLLSGLINLIIGSLSEIYTLAALPWWMALIMIGISVILTLVSGVIPARAAAKKDPVEALRTE